MAGPIPWQGEIIQVTDPKNLTVTSILPAVPPQRTSCKTFPRANRCVRTCTLHPRDQGGVLTLPCRQDILCQWHGGLGRRVVKKYFL